MLPALAAALLSKDEKAVVKWAAGLGSEVVPGDSNGLIAALLSRIDFSAFLDELRGEAPLSPFLSGLVSIVHESAQRDILEPILADLISHAQAKGLKPEAIASLTRKAGRHLNLVVDVPADALPHQVVAQHLSALAASHTFTVHGIGAVAVCPRCDYAHLV